MNQYAILLVVSTLNTISVYKILLDGVGEPLDITQVESISLMDCPGFCIDTVAEEVSHQDISVN